MDLALCFPRFMPAFFGQFGFPAPELAFQAIRDQVDGLVEIVPVILGVKVRPGKREMDFHDEGLLVQRSLRRVMLDGNMSGDDSIFVTLQLL